MRNKEKEKKNNKWKIIAVVSIIVIILMITIVIIVMNQNNDKDIEDTQNKEINMNVEAVVYYNFQNTAEATLKEDGQVFSKNTTISWREGCTGIIKKNGQDFSNKSGTVLLEDGSYEITVTSPKKVSVTRKLIIDKTPPEVEIQKNSDGAYTILFKNINDVETAILYRRKNKDDKDVENIDLKQKGLQEKMEIKEKGTYILECTDGVQNINTQKFRID